MESGLAQVNPNGSDVHAMILQRVSCCIMPSRHDQRRTISLALLELVIQQSTSGDNHHHTKVPRGSKMEIPVNVNSDCEKLSHRHSQNADKAVAHFQATKNL